MYARRWNECKCTLLSSCFFVLYIRGFLFYNTSCVLQLHPYECSLYVHFCLYEIWIYFALFRREGIPSNRAMNLPLLLRTNSQIMIPVGGNVFNVFRTATKRMIWNFIKVEVVDIRVWSSILTLPYGNFLLLVYESVWLVQQSKLVAVLGMDISAKGIYWIVTLNSLWILR